VQQQKFAQADAPRRRFVAQMPWDVEMPAPLAGRSAVVGRSVGERQRPRTAGKRKLGRNALCWCGSGTKYKRLSGNIAWQKSIFLR
jgi:hypothetical protein